MRRRAQATAVAALTGVLIAGCGGTPGGASTPTTATRTARRLSGHGLKTASGHAIFESAGCRSCRTLAAAGATGEIGPDLDDLRPTTSQVTRKVEQGGGGMPAFHSKLSAAQIRAVAGYVASVAGKR